LFYQSLTRPLFYCIFFPIPQVGDVLVERTVGEVLPAVEQNLTQIEEVRRAKSLLHLFFLSLASSSSSLSSLHLFLNLNLLSKKQRQVLTKLRCEAERKDRELAAHIKKYKIRMSSGQEQQQQQAASGGGGGGGGGQQGILV